MMSHSRVLPLSTYRDPNYDSDTSFENYYLNYAEENKPSPVCDNTDQAVDDDDDHNNMEMITETKEAYDHRRGVIRRVRSDNPRRKRTRWGLMITTPDNSSQISTITATTTAKNYDDDDDPTVKNDRAVGSSSSVLFIRRELQKADMNEQQHRLSLPRKQVLIEPDRFFTKDESTRMENRLPVPARMVDPRGQEYGINLRLTKSGPNTFCYGIGKPWLRIKDENGFEPGMVLDVRATRRQGGELCFTLHRVVV